jgi:hypothetical protein
MFLSRYFGEHILLKSMQRPLRLEKVVDLEPIVGSFELRHRENPHNETRVITIKTCNAPDIRNFFFCLFRRNYEEIPGNQTRCFGSAINFPNESRGK